MIPSLIQANDSADNTDECRDDRADDYANDGKGYDDGANNRDDDGVPLWDV